jgi:intracellular multiplication protein IcmD
MLKMKRSDWSIVLIIFLLVVSEGAWSASVSTIGQMASLITHSFASIAKLITAMSYIAGIGFSLGAVMKFKSHKDNPTQVTIGTPVAMLFIAAALLFFPTVLGMTGMSIFGTTQTAGSLGTAWSSGS